MAGYSSLSRYRINGVINTDEGVLTNMEKLANTTASWISYDVFQGKWDVVINKAENVSMFFDDSNIIGSIQLNVLSLKEMYNAVEVRFPHIDLNGQKDYIKIAIPPEDKLANELENVLTINYDLVNDPVQAMYLGLQELKQARLDKTITFRTDFSTVGIFAGAVIAVTNSTFGWTDKKFRIVTVKEIADNDALHSEITAIEYDENVYSTDDLERYIRTNASGIVAIGAIGKPNNPQITIVDYEARPKMIIEADVPSGLVSGMEYWLTYDTNIGSDENRSYDLIGTITGINDQSLNTGDTTYLYYDAYEKGNLLVKVRGINSDSVGPFSDPAGILYQPTQVTDAVGQNTGILDQNNDAITNLLASNALLWLLNQLLSGNTNTSGTSIGIQDLFGYSSNVANVLAQTTTGIGTIAGQGKRVMVIASTGKTTVANLAQTGSSHTQMYQTSFVPQITGTYKLDCIFDQNYSGAFGATTDIVSVIAQLDQGSTTVGGGGSGGEGSWYWTDYVITDTVQLTAGLTYTLTFYYRQDTTSSYGDDTASFDISWTVYSTVLD